jgi:hypothetical protein
LRLPDDGHVVKFANTVKQSIDDRVSATLCQPSDRVCNFNWCGLDLWEHEMLILELISISPRGKVGEDHSLVSNSRSTFFSS